VTFRHGKGFAARGPYTVHTTWPLQYEALLTSFLYYPPSSGPLFTQFLMPSMLAAVKEVEPQLNLRTLRRGALQTMAAAGTDLEVLRTFSGHTGVEMLKRYLDWNRVNASATAAGTEAAAALISRH
jgi:hypothetical protein